jgi:amidase
MLTRSRDARENREPHPRRSQKTMPQQPDPAQAFMPYPGAPVPHSEQGPLSGLSFGVKDLFDVAGYPTSGGSPVVLAMSGTKARSAPVVGQLLSAGARFVGKTVTDEFAFSLNGNNAHFGAPINGAAPERISGGSSSGSAAAVSGGLCDFALGTDTGGSVRGPASHCGLFGLRPTHGRISLDGCQPLAPSLDSCGWFTRNSVDSVRVARVLLGADEHPLSQHPKLLWPEDLWSLAVPSARASLGAAVARIRALLGEPEIVSAALESFDRMYWSFRFIQGREAWISQGRFIEAWHIPLGPGVAERFAWSRTVSDADHSEAWIYRKRFTEHLERLLGQDGVMVLPTMPDIAPLRSAQDAELEDYRNRAIRLLSPAGLAGLPQISIPFASHQGAPLGISLIGPRGCDASLVQLAHSIATTT